MRSHEERIAEVKTADCGKGVSEKAGGRNGSLPFSAVAACLAIIVGVSLFMPDMVNRMEPGISSGFGTAATMLGGSAALGYIVTGSARLYPWCVCDNRVLPYLSCCIRTNSRGSKRGQYEWNLPITLCNSLLPCWACCLSGMRYLKGRKQAYFLLTSFYGCFALGSLYWTLYLFCSQKRRRFLCIEFGWVASVIFHFYFAILPFPLRRKEGFVCRRARIAFLIGVPLCIFYCTFGDVLSNLLWCGMMIAVSYHAIRGLTYARTQTERHGSCDISISGCCAMWRRNISFGLPAASGRGIRLSFSITGLMFC